MKSTAILNLLILSFILAFGGTACKKKPVGITNIPGMKPGAIVAKSSNEIDPGLGRPLPTGDSANTTGTTTTGFTPTGDPIPHGDDRAGIEGRRQNPEMFAADTVYFDFDSSTVKSSQKSKLESVASGFKSLAAGDLLIEGHCDERGTEGYNLSLGDRRANALREYLVNLGLSADRVHTVSFGEAKPADPGQGEAAWSKNRRGEFIFIEPAK